MTRDEYSQSEMNGWIDLRVIRKESKIEGTGLYATESIKEGEVLFKWGGKVVGDSALKQIESEGKYHSSVAIGEDKNLLFNVIDPKAKQVESKGSGVGGFNHSCDPNLWMQDEVTVEARRDIKAGEELTIDYSMFTVAPNWSIEECKCGASLCRHKITGNDWKLPDLHERYKDHFSPFINERIKNA